MPPLCAKRRATLPAGAQMTTGFGQLSNASGAMAVAAPAMCTARRFAHCSKALPPMAAPEAGPYTFSAAVPARAC